MRKFIGWVLLPRATTSQIDGKQTIRKQPTGKPLPRPERCRKLDFCRWTVYCFDGVGWLCVGGIKVSNKHLGGGGAVFVALFHFYSSNVTFMCSPGLGWRLFSPMPSRAQQAKVATYAGWACFDTGRLNGTRTRRIIKDEQESKMNLVTMMGGDENMVNRRKADDVLGIFMFGSAL